MKIATQTVLALIASIAFAAPVWAGGSLPLEEVLTAVAKAPKLVAEIAAELDKNSLKAASVICGGARHGNIWKYLGGGRAAPYECEIGKRSITIEADRIYYDAKGKPLGSFENADPKRAKTFQESNFKWSWAP